MLVEIATENTQNHVQLNSNFKLCDIFLSHLVTDVNTSASKRKKIISLWCNTDFFQVYKISVVIFGNIISAPFTIFVWILL